MLYRGGVEGLDFLWGFLVYNAGMDDIRLYI